MYQKEPNRLLFSEVFWMDSMSLDEYVKGIKSIEV